MIVGNALNSYLELNELKKILYVTLKISSCMCHYFITNPYAKKIGHLRFSSSRHYILGKVIISHTQGIRKKSDAYSDLM